MRKTVLVGGKLSSRYPHHGWWWLDRLCGSWRKGAGPWNYEGNVHKDIMNV